MPRFLAFFANVQKPSLCPVCKKGTDFELIQEWKEFSLFECAFCNVQFWAPFKSMGGEWYEAKTKYQLGSVARPKISREYHAYFIQKEGNSLQGKRVLDIGCGTGEFLFELEKLGTQAWGVDFDKNAIESAKRFFNLQHVYHASLEEFQKQFPEMKFDIVTCFETIQYSDVPLSFFEAMKSVLEKNGKVIVSIVSRDRFFPNTVQWDFPPNHVSRWNEEALVNVAKLAGLRLVSLRYLERFRILRETAASPFQTGAVGRAVSMRSSSLATSLLAVLGIIKAYLIGTIPALFLFIAGKVMRKKYGTIYAEFNI